MENGEKFDQIKYINQYNKENYDRIYLMVPKGKKEAIKAKAKAAGKSINEYINIAISEKMKEDA